MTLMTKVKSRQPMTVSHYEKEESKEERKPDEDGKKSKSKQEHREQDTEPKQDRGQPWKDRL